MKWLAGGYLVASLLPACTRAGAQPPPGAPEPAADVAPRALESTESLADTRSMESKMTPRLAAIFRRVNAGLRHDAQYMEYARRELQLRRGAARTAGMPEAGAASSAEQVSSLGALAAARGAARLPSAQLAELAALRLRLLQRSPRMCAGSWFGGVTQRDAMLAMDASFSDFEVRRWFELNLTAARLEIHAEQPVPPILADDVSEALLALLESMPEAQAASLAETMQMGTSAPPEAACEALKELIAGGLRLPEQQRSPLLLAFIFPVLVDEGASGD
jgi:hypothetical protein